MLSFWREESNKLFHNKPSARHNGKNTQNEMASSIFTISERTSQRQTKYVVFQEGRRTCGHIESNWKEQLHNRTSEKIEQLLFKNETHELHTDTHRHTHTHIYIYTYTQRQTQTHTHIYIYNTCTHTHRDTRRDTLRHTYCDIHTHTHADRRAHTHTDTETETQTHAETRRQPHTQRHIYTCVYIYIHIHTHAPMCATTHSERESETETARRVCFGSKHRRRMLQKIGPRQTKTHLI